MADVKDKEQGDYRNDNRYKRFESALERNLATFESISEWADIIAFLSRLNKTLLSHPQFSALPHKDMVCKRLAQCLNPNLPSGVHQKTLETYVIIFQKIGHDGLLKDYPIYTSGLFPFFEFASSSVRLEYLEIVNKFLIPLGEEIKNFLQDLVISLLPGLEEESNESFAKTFRTLGTICNTVGRETLNLSLWTSMALSGKHRLAICNYFNKVQPTKITDQNASNFCAGRSDLVIAALCCGLCDRQSLVVRSILDLIYTHFPLSSTWLSQEEKIVLAESILIILLKRDMSLSRRVFQWILTDVPGGDSVFGDTSPQTLGDSAVVILSDALKSMLTRASIEADDAALRPYRVLIYLADRPGFMESIFEKIFANILQFYCTKRSANDPILQKIQSTAIQLFSAVELPLIWSCIRALFLNFEVSMLPAILNQVSIAVEDLKICIDEGASIYAPQFAAWLVTEHQSLDAANTNWLSTLLESMNIIIPKFASSQGPDTIQTLQHIVVFPKVPHDPIECIVLLTTEIVKAFENQLEVVTHLHCELFSKFIDCIFARAEGSDPLLLKLMDCEWLETPPLKILKNLSHVVDGDLFAAQATIVMKFGAFQGRSSRLLDRKPKWTLVPSIPLLLDRAISSLYITEPLLDVLCSLYAHHPHVVDAFFCRKLGSATGHEKSHIISKIDNIWNQAVARPDCPAGFLPKSTMCLFELLSDENPDISAAALAWFNRSHEHLDRILSPILTVLLDGLSVIEEPALTFVSFYSDTFNANQICYCLRQLNIALEVSNRILINAFNSLLCDKRFFDELLASLPPRYKLIDSPKDATYITVLLLVAIPFACSEASAGADDNLRTNIDSIQKFAQKLLLAIMFNWLKPSPNLLFMAYEIFIDKLQYSIQCSSFHSQPQVIEVIESILQCLMTVSHTKPNISFPDVDSLTKIVTHLTKVVNAPEVFQAWTEFLSSVMTFGYFEDAETKLVEPVCQALLLRPLTHNDCDNSLDSSAFDLETVIFSSICDLLVTAIKSSAESKSSMSRSLSIQLLDSAKGARHYSRSILREEPVAGKNKIEFKPSSVSLLVPAFLCKLLGTSKYHLYCPKKTLALVRKLYDSKPSGVIYLILDHVVSRLELVGESTLGIETPLMKIFAEEFGLLDTGLIKILEDFYQYIKDPKNETFPRLNLESLLHVIHWICKAFRGTNRQLCCEVAGLLILISKDILASSSKYRSSIYVLSMCLCAIIPWFHERNDDLFDLKDLMDVFLRVADASITLASKSNDPNLWSDYNQLSIKSDQLLSPNTICLLSKDKSSGKAFAVLVEIFLPCLETTLSGFDRIQQIVSLFLSQLLLPNLKSAALKSHYPSMIAERGLLYLCSQSGLHRFWKQEFWNSIFMEPIFFNLSPNILSACIPILETFLETDPEKVTEVLSKIAPSGSSNLFLSREIESLNRAWMVRRLSIIAFAAEIEILKTYIPQMQEKIVDLLRLGIGLPAAEVYLLVAILLYRLREEMPTTLWPVIFAEVASLIRSLLKADTDFSSIPSLTSYTMHQCCFLIDIISLTSCTTPVLYFWCFLVKNSAFRQIFDRLSIQMNTSCIGKMADEKRPLVPGNWSRNLHDLAPFLYFAPERFASVEYLLAPIDDEAIKSHLLLAFTLTLENPERK